MAYDGGCLCGQVRWRAETEPVNVRFCHCRLCQKATGGAFFARALFERSAFRESGDTTRHASSHRLVRRACAACGTPLFADPLDCPELIAVSVATCDEPETLPPGSHIWTSAKLAWLKLDDDLPKYPGPAPD